LSFRGFLCTLLAVVLMVLFAVGLAIFQAGSENAQCSGTDVRVFLTSTISDPFFWVATIAFAALAYQLAR
jgi:ABC-type antimicrobial peptide transport system permease subunit